MPKDTQPAADGADGADESFDGVRIEALAPSPSREPDQPDQGTRSNPDGSATAPGWTKRLSTRGKLARALITALVVTVALIALLPRLSLSLPSGIGRLLTPAPTHTPLPGAFTTGSFEHVAGPPISAQTYFQLTASSSDPATAYACVALAFADATGVEASGHAVLWLTHDAGHTWQEIILPTAPGTNCTVTPALDGSLVTLSVDDPELDPNGQACAHSRYFLSEDDGATWRPVQHSSIAPPVSESGFCLLWGSGSRLFLETYVTNNGEQWRSFLERSDDGGLTWARADQGIAELSWFATPLDASGDTLGALVGRAPDLWITHDAGASWHNMGPVARDMPETGMAWYLATEASLGGAPKRCGCVFAVRYTPHPDAIIGQHAYVSHDYTQWAPLPPLPVTGTNALRSGVFDTLGLTVDGKLLALGAEPSAGIPDIAHPTHGPPPRLWAWDTHSERWELAEKRVPCQDLQSCTLYPVGSSTVFGADGEVRGTMFWLSVVGQTEEVQPPPQTIYRLFIPAD